MTEPDDGPLVQDEGRVCAECGELKLPAEFAGNRQECKPCQSRLRLEKPNSRMPAVSEALQVLPEEVPALLKQMAENPPDHETLANVCLTKAGRILAYMTEDKIAKASISTQALAMGILVDKANILRGKPTAIFGYEDRTKRRQTIAQLEAELKRRGHLIDVTPA